MPYGLALRTGVSGHADKGYVTCYNASSGGAQVIPFLLGGRGLGNIGQANEDPGIAADQLPGTFQPYGSTFGTAVASTTLTNPVAASFTPDGTQAVVVGFGTNVINVLNADTDAVTHAYTLANVGTSLDVVCDNTYAYITDYWGGQVAKVTISSGTTTATGASTFTGPQRLTLTPDGSKVVFGTSAGTVVVLNSSNLTTAQTVSLVGLSGGGGTIGSSTVVNSVKVTPDGTTAWALVATSTAATLVSINLSTYAATAYALPYTAGNGSDLAIAPTGTNAWIVYVGGKASQAWLTGTYKGQSYVNVGSPGWTGTGAVRITNDGQIYVTTQDHVWEWPGATFAVTDGGFNGNQCTVMVTGAAS
jgi:hypothetical protein